MVSSVELQVYEGNLRKPAWPFLSVCVTDFQAAIGIGCVGIWGGRAVRAMRWQARAVPTMCDAVAMRWKLHQ